jgi:ubiquitin-protein ligase
MEMVKTLELGIALLEVTRILAANPTLFALLRPDGTNMDSKLGKHHSIAKEIKDVMAQSKMMLQTDTKLSELKEDSDEARMLTFAELIVHVGSTIHTQSRAYLKARERYEQLFKVDLEDSKAESKEEKEQTETEKVDEKKQAEIAECEDYLRSSQFRTGLLIGDNVPLRHIFANDVNNGGGDAKRMMRIRQEMATMTNNMPPGIFVTFDQKRFDVLRCLIIGAEGTPYANGCFLFDMYIPTDYPNSPPKCKIITTGKGTFRFNPNLYTNGKVCLSLLGTWQGPGWDPQMSTMMQVFLSIQAMIMCMDPIANEPGWESKVGTPKGRRFNLSVQHATMLFAMKWHLNENPYGFEDIIKSHFYVNKEAILKQIAAWKLDSEQPCSASASCNYGSEDVVSQESVDTTVTELIALLEALEKPALPTNDSDSDSDDDSDDE